MWLWQRGFVGLCMCLCRRVDDFGRCAYLMHGTAVEEYHNTFKEGNATPRVNGRRVDIYILIGITLII